MSDNNVRIPMGHETTAKKKSIGLIVATLAAGSAALAAVYLFVPKLDERIAAGNEAPMSTVILDEEGRSMRLVRQDGSRRTFIEARTSSEYRSATGEPATFSAVIGANAKSPLVGRLIRIDDVPVQSVLGDKVFTIGPSAEANILVHIDEPTQPGNQGEWELVVRPSNRVFVVGRLEARPGPDWDKARGIDATEEARVGNKSHYLKAVYVEKAASQ